MVCGSLTVSVVATADGSGRAARWGEQSHPVISTVVMASSLAAALVATVHDIGVAELVRRMYLCIALRYRCRSCARSELDSSARTAKGAFETRGSWTMR